MNNKLNKFFAILMIVWILSSCTETNNIEKIETKKEEISNISEREVKNFRTNFENAKNKINNSWENQISENIWEKKLSINDRCIGCSKCVRIAPTNFAMDYDTRKSIVTSQENTSSERVQASIDICPVDAIELG